MSNVTVSFYRDNSMEKPSCRLYLHGVGSDLGPYEYATECLEEFFERLSKKCAHDTRFDDPEYLAARFVVFYSELNHKAKQEWSGKKKIDRLDFTGIGIATTETSPEDYGADYDIQVVCGSGFKSPIPQIMVHKVDLSLAEKS